MEVIYRQAVPEDAQALLDYLKTVGGESDNLTFGAAGIPVPLDREIQILANQHRSDRSLILLALLGNEIIGNATIDGSSNPRFEHRRNLAITVRKDYWGKGIGSELMTRLIQFAKETRAEVISLQVRSDNKRAINLYRKFGFEKYGSYPKFFKINGNYADIDYMNLYF